MTLAGKCPPEPEELEEVVRKGFENAELYLTKKHLDRFDKTVSHLSNSDLNIVSVHTPHVGLDDSDYFLKTDRLASEMDAFLVFHSQYLHHVHIPELEKLDIKSDYGYENNPGISVRAIESLVLRRGHKLVLDTAHLFMAEENYIEKIRYLLQNYRSQIEVVHICDSSKVRDGLGFGEGEMDMENICRTVDRNFDDISVLEVMPEYQEEARRDWESYTG